MGLETNDGVADRLTVTLAEVGPLSFYCGESDKLAADSISASELAPFASLQHCLSNISSADSPHKLQARIAWTGDIHLLSDPHLIPQVYLDLDNT